MNTFQVQRVSKEQASDIILTTELGGIVTTMRMTAEAWSKAIASQEPAPVQAFKQGTR